MLGSLRARLIVSFALVVGLAVFLAGAGALFLLRDKQQESAEERYGYLVGPLNDRLAADTTAGKSIEEVRAFLDERALDTGVRILLLDATEIVIYDSAGGELVDEPVISFEGSNVSFGETSGGRYRFVDYDRNDADLALFAPIINEQPDGETQPAGDFAAPQYMALIAVPQSELTSAWLELVPRLALAGLIALTVSFVVSWFISRSISGPLARITAASKQMAQGDYDVHIPIRGEDEVGRLSEAFNYMAQEVSRNQQMMRDLLANVSHELKTPLTSIQGFSQAVVDGMVTREDDVKEYSRTIYDEANRMRDLVDDLLLLSQIESGQVAMQHGRVDLEGVLERTLERFQWAIKDAGIDARMRIGRIPSVHGDARRLEQVFSNLLQNAVRHTPRAGTITISASTLTGGHVSVSVHNTGSVIPKSDISRVFERFFQVDRARTRKGGSSGLGLSIVKEIVEAHGGTVRAISSAAAGTEFVVVLPNPEAFEAQLERAQPPPEAAPMRPAPRSTEATG
jgi:signal transduction histidine kinase